MLLSGKVIVIIGGGSGIGQAIALRFAGEGAQVAVADIREDAGRETVGIIHQAAGKGDFYPVDVTQPEQIRVLMNQIEARFGRLDTLVNSAGIPGRGRIEDVADDLWDQAVAINLSGVYWACRYALPPLRRTGGGTIINLASVAGLRGWPGSAIYSATKGGVVMLSRSLAADYARENIRVWALCPTAVDTPLVNRLFEASTDPLVAKQAYEANEPMGRMITPEEVANSALYLASDQRPPYTPEPLIV